MHDRVGRIRVLATRNLHEIVAWGRIASRFANRLLSPTSAMDVSASVYARQTARTAAARDRASGAIPGPSDGRTTPAPLDRNGDDWAPALGLDRQHQDRFELQPRETTMSGWSWNSSKSQN
jgi:hypothetical protein